MITVVTTAQEHKRQQSQNARKPSSSFRRGSYSSDPATTLCHRPYKSSPSEPRPLSANPSWTTQLCDDDYRQRSAPYHDDYNHSIGSIDSVNYPGAVTYDYGHSSTHGGRSDPGVYPSQDSISEGRETPCDIYCPVCGSRVVTVVILKRKTKAWKAFMILFVLFMWPFCLIPLCCRQCQYPVHFCPRCHSKLSHSKYERVKYVDQELETV